MHSASRTLQNSDCDGGGFAEGEYFYATFDDGEAGTELALTHMV